MIIRIMSETEPKRFGNVAVVRLVLTLMIFAFHCLYCHLADDGQQWFPLSCGLQGFNFLAAYLCSRKTVSSWKGYYRRRMTKLIAPGLVVIVLMILMNFFFLWGTGPLGLEAYLATFKGTTPTGFGLYSFGTLWYPFAMAACFALVPVFFLANRKRWIWIPIGAFCLAELIASVYFWQPLVFSPFAFGFYYGFIIGENDVDPMVKTHFITSWKAPLIALPLLLVLNYSLRVWAKPVGAWDGAFLTMSMRLVMAMIGIDLVILLLRLLRFMGVQRNRFLDFSDKVSYPFFITHFMFLVGCFDMARYVKPLFLSFLVSGLCALALAYGVYAICRPIVAFSSRPIRAGEAETNE